ncbi:PEP-CTERM sorting domain-containing protein [Gloeothece verrucosa]|uniref:PEP-CTERM protein-sorting domain-containing protein n=1 Tax=Gloeothece verrucosa (strain PCC 7822) TaxID=497965 RepID=E0UBC7_GLOV7|nr:PEP-CTERM sorting domain-containing protein [Gloeothece verrucosa]ADN12759.1 hypothetical protein Cyan7822_0730 [Gloeothece verrucosa PCC 7822]
MYDFSTSMASSDPISFAELIFKINNQQIGSNFTASTTTINKNTNFQGNDLTVDDISLTAVKTLPEPSMIVGLGVITGLGWLILRKNCGTF